MKAKIALLAISGILLIGVFTSFTSSKLIYPLTFKKYKNDNVSVQTSVNLAMASYLTACVRTHKKYRLGRALNQCVKEANQYVKNDIVMILDTP